MKKAISFCFTLLATCFAIPALACAPNCAPPPPPLCVGTSNMMFHGDTFAKATGQRTSTIGQIDFNVKTTGPNGSTTGFGTVGTQGFGTGNSTGQTAATVADRRQQGRTDSSTANSSDLLAKSTGQNTMGFGEANMKSTLTAGADNNAKIMYSHGFEGTNATGSGFTGGSFGTGNGMFSFAGGTGPQ